MNLFILDKDTDYLERFKHYMSKKYTHMQISVCDNIDTAKILLHETVFDVVLFSAEFDNVKLEELSVSNSDIIFSTLVFQNCMRVFVSCMKKRKIVLLKQTKQKN